MEPSSLIRLEDASYRKTEVKHRASTLESGTSSFIFMGLKCKFAWITHDFCIFPDKSLVVKKVFVTLQEFSAFLCIKAVWGIEEKQGYE
jgi:hypothetical protein